MNKNVRLFFILLIAGFFVSCSDLNVRTTSISFQMPDDISSRINESIQKEVQGMAASGSGPVYTCTVKITGDYNTVYPHDYETLDSLKDAVILIEGIPVDSIIRIEIEISIYGNVIYQGISDVVKIAAGDNDVEVVIASKEPGGPGGGIEGSP